MKYVIACTILLFSFGTLNAQTRTKIQADYSPSGNLIAEHYFTSSDEPRQIFLMETTGHSKPIFLVSYRRNAKVLFSPNERWLVLNDNLGSNISQVRLFKRDQGLHYQEVADAPLHAVVWTLFERRVPAGRVDYVHTYTDVICWGPASDSLLIEIRADGILLKDKLFEQFGPWRCVYYIDRSEADDDPLTLSKFLAKNAQCK